MEKTVLKFGDTEKHRFHQYKRPPWCSGYHYRTTSFDKVRTQVLRRFTSCSWRVGDLR